MMSFFCSMMTIALSLVLVGCGSDTIQKTVEKKQYMQISQDEAKRMMKEKDGHVIVDVRRKDEYDAGHIPGAILIPNEDIDKEPPAELPDLDQIILVYCRSGRRSKEASQKLADMGYSHVYEFGGILDWTGEIEKEAKPSEEEEGDMTPNAVLVVSTGERSFTVDLENNVSAQEFFEKVKKDSIQVKMCDYGSFEKVGELPWSITRSDKEITTSPGDLILYQGNQITIYYDKNTWDFTKLGKLNGTEEEIKEAFGGKEDVIVDFYVEWTE